VSGRLHLYQIDTKWNIPPQKPSQPPPKQYDKPELHVSLLNIEDNAYPTMLNSDVNSGAQSTIRLLAQLTHLDFLPATPKQGDGSLPTIQAVFLTPPNMVVVDQTQSTQTPFSIVARWEVHQVQQNQSHPSLDKVTSNRKSVSSVPARNVWALRRQQDNMMHSVILSFTPVWYAMVLGFIYSDGTIDFRKRETLSIIAPEYATEVATSMAQSGFSFSAYEPSIYTALSPNRCIAACMQEDGKIKLRSMEYTFGSLASDDTDPRHSAALAALVLQSTTAANQYITNDDIFSIIGPLSPARKEEFINLMFQSLSVNLDCGIDDQSSNHLILLGRSPFFVKTLSAIYLLGLEGHITRSLSSKTAWMILNIKYVTQILTTIARMHGQIDKNPLRPEIVPQFIGICRWIMHFITYMIDELLELGRTLLTLQKYRKKTLTKQLLEYTMKESDKATLLVLLSAFPRMMFRLWIQPLHWISRTAQSYVNGNSSVDMRRLYSPLQNALLESPADIRQFDHLVNEVHQLVRNCYTRDPQTSKDGKDGEAARNRAERELLAGRIPDVLWPAAQRLVGESLWGPADGRNENKNSAGIASPATARCLADKVDVAKITFFDTTWLGFTHSKRAESFFDSHVVDVCQKFIIRGTGTQTHPLHPNSTVAATVQNGRNRSESIQSVDGSGVAVDEARRNDRRLRRCVRCGAHMEDVVHGLPGYENQHINWLMSVAKHCVCGNGWMLVP
jgi:mediator of RNA polymerase II transcription subunit 16